MRAPPSGRTSFQGPNLFTFVRHALVAASILFLVGCVTVAPHTVSLDTIHNLKIVDVEITGGEAIRSWPEGEKAYAQSPGADPAIIQGLQTKAISLFPPVRDFAAAQLRTMLRAEFDAKLGPALNGPRAVRAVVHLKKFDIPSGGRLILTGSEPASFDADVTLVDARTGAPVVSYPGKTALYYNSGGIGGALLSAIADDPAIQLVQKYTGYYRDWLLGTAQS
jgi:hypothetical protein